MMITEKKRLLWCLRMFLLIIMIMPLPFESVQAQRSGRDKKGSFSRTQKEKKKPQQKKQSTDVPKWTLRTTPVISSASGMDWISKETRQLQERERTFQREREINRFMYQSLSEQQQEMKKIAEMNERFYQSHAVDYSIFTIDFILSDIIKNNPDIANNKISFDNMVVLKIGAFDNAPSIIFAAPLEDENRNCAVDPISAGYYYARSIYPNLAATTVDSCVRRLLQLSRSLIGKNLETDKMLNIQKRACFLLTDFLRMLDTIDMPHVNLYLVFYNESIDLNNDFFATAQYLLMLDGEKEIEVNSESYFEYEKMNLIASQLSGLFFTESNYPIHENKFSKISILHTTPYDIYPEILLNLLNINY